MEVVSTFFFLMEVVRGLTLETSAFESLYGDQFTSSVTHLIKPFNNKRLRIVQLI